MATALPSAITDGSGTKIYVPAPLRAAFETLRVMAVAGVVAGVLVLGVGGRLAMLVLRLTSPDSVIGLDSDDGFTIGRFTLSGTYALLVIGAAFGVIGAGVYVLVAARLIGPRWFRRLTVGLAAGAVGGAMLVRTDGIDFTVLKPTWLAISLFVAVPAGFAVAVGAVADGAAHLDGFACRGRRKWILPVVLLAAFPPSAFVLAILAAPVIILTLIAATEPVARVRTSTIYVRLVQAAWLFIAFVGLVMLAGDVLALT